MNVVPLEPVLPERLRRQLATLPEFAPPAGLRERVAARTWNAPRRTRVLHAAGAAVFLLAATAAGWWGLRPPSATTPSLAQRIAGLERDVGALRVSGGAGGATVAALEGELARIDRTLQAAYAADAPAAVRERLWRDREAVLDQLLLAYRRPDRLIRI